MSEKQVPSSLAILAGLAVLYLVWGSTYLAIRIAIETMPPFTMAGVRFTIAGTLLYVWSAPRERSRPTARQVGNAAAVGFCLLSVGNGGVVWAEQWVSSGMVALMVAAVPFFMVVIDWLFGKADRPSPVLLLGIVWGLLGMVFLVSSNEISGQGGNTLAGALVVMGAAVSWAGGSIYSRYADMPRSPRTSTAVQMLSGGAVLLAAGALRGEWTGLEIGDISLRSTLALVYLILFGAVLAFTVYVWLIRVSTPVRVSTYAYVNPVVALFLGWALLAEPLTPRTLLAAMVILSAVALITTQETRTSGKLRIRSTQ